MQKVGSSIRFGDEIMGQLRDMRGPNKPTSPTDESQSGNKSSFYEHLKEAVAEVNQFQVEADKKATDLANGKSSNIHETMLSASQAELSFNLMVQVRNKALEAYQEIMRLPV